MIQVKLLLDNTDFMLGGLLVVAGQLIQEFGFVLDFSSGGHLQEFVAHTGLLGCSGRGRWEISP